MTVCGRAGSKGIKNKNISDFLDYPLPYYTFSIIDLFIKKHKEYKVDVVLSTDSDALIELVEALNMGVHVIKRSSELALDNTPKVSVISSCLNYMKTSNQKIYEMVVDLDITSPLRRLVDLENLISKKMNSNAEVVFSVTDSRRNPYFNMVKKNGDYYEGVIKTQFISRQEAPEIYDMNASMYAYTEAFLQSGKGIFDATCDVIKMIDTAVLDLDHPSDLELMTVIAEYFYKSDLSFGEVKNNILNIIK